MLLGEATILFIGLLGLVALLGTLDLVAIVIHPVLLYSI